MKKKGWDIKRRKFTRLDLPVQLSIKFLGVARNAKPVNTESVNVSIEGFLIELKVILKDGSLLIQEGGESIKLIPYLVLNEKVVELDITMPPKDEKIRARGRIIWYDFGSGESTYYFMAGIFLEEMGTEEKKKWDEFIKKQKPETGLHLKIS